MSLHSTRLALVALFLALCLPASLPALANPTVPQGGTSTFALTGNDVVQAGYAWQIFQQGLLDAIATNRTPNGWS